MIGIVVAAMLQSPSDIVVTGQRLEQASRRCAARPCTPLEDARASIAQAEELFRRGQYQPAKRLLAAAIARNRHDAVTDPRPVAALYEAYATVSLHEGDLARYRGAVVDQVRTLRDHLPVDDLSVVDSGLVLGDMWLKLGNSGQAERAYRGVERDATAAGRSSLAVMAVIRRAVLASGLGQYAQAGALIDAVAARQTTLDPAIRAVLPVVRLRLAAKRADDHAVDALVAGLRSDRAGAPVLVWAPPYAQTAAVEADRQARQFNEISPVAARSNEYSPVLWVDIGFWIRPDGRTAEAEILRGTPTRAWTAPVLNQIARRRYMASTRTGPGTYRVERFTFRPTYSRPIGSLIARRAGPASLEVLDLTAPDGAPGG